MTDTANPKAPSADDDVPPPPPPFTPGLGRPETLRGILGINGIFGLGRNKDPRIYRSGSDGTGVRQGHRIEIRG